VSRGSDRSSGQTIQETATELSPTGRAQNFRITYRSNSVAVYLTVWPEVWDRSYVESLVLSFYLKLRKWEMTKYWTVPQGECCWLIFWMTSKTLWKIHFKLEDCDIRLRFVDDTYILFGEDINVSSPVVTIRTISFKLKFCFPPTQCIYVSCMDQRLFPYTALHGGRDFSHTSRPALRPTQPPVQWVPGLSRG
jgi:hypothetical protein